MRLSKLQKFIIFKSFENKNPVSKDVFYNFYPQNVLEENRRNIQDSLHKSLESLNKNDLIITYGRKTAEKWFINKVKLTNTGRKIAKELIKNRQRKLPIK